MFRLDDGGKAYGYINQRWVNDAVAIGDICGLTDKEMLSMLEHVSWASFWRSEKHDLHSRIFKHAKVDESFVAMAVERLTRIVADGIKERGLRMPVQNVIEKIGEGNYAILTKVNDRIRNLKDAIDRYQDLLHPEVINAYRSLDLPTFGDERNNRELEDDVKSHLHVARSIFQYIQDNQGCTSRDLVLFLVQQLGVGPYINSLFPPESIKFERKTTSLFI